MMSDWQQQIEAQIASLRNEGWYATEHTEAAPIAEAMQALLDVAVAVDEMTYADAVAGAETWGEMKQALDKLREALRSESENKPLPVGPHDRSWCG